jgi:hypothetical protein
MKLRGVKMVRLDEDQLEEILNAAENTQWHKVGKVYFPARPTVERLPPGYYEVYTVWGEIQFAKTEISTTGIFLTGSSNAQEIITDIDKFWDSKAVFDEYEVPYKRGVFLSGPPGSGKTCIIKLLAQSVIARKGALIDVNTNVGLIGRAVETVRDIHKDMPLIIVMEDIDRWLNDRGPEQLMNIMDGITAIEGVVFIATANLTEDLDDAIINRPGRFDAHYRIMPPAGGVRRAFIERTLKAKASEYDLDKWTKDTDGLPFGHIKELVISVVVFNKDYEKTLVRLGSMRDGQFDDGSEKCVEAIPDDWNPKTSSRASKSRRAVKVRRR